LFAYLAISTLTRAALFLASVQDIACSPGLVVEIFGTGILFDAVTFAYAMVPLVVYLSLVPARLYRKRMHARLLYTVSAAALFGMIFIATAEYFFWDEFGTRFNFIAVDYLIYTREVFGNIWQSYPMPALIAAMLVATAGSFLLVKRGIDLSAGHAGTLKSRLAGALVLLGLTAAGYCFVDLSRSTVSDNKFANSLAANGAYSFCEAFMHNALDYYEFYRVEPDAAAMGDLRRLIASEDAPFADRSPAARTIRRAVGNKPGGEARLNVVLVMMESMSAEYFGAFGNRAHLTPSLDEIARGGMLFTNMYATGTRTVRGMEAVMLSVPPTPGRSIVKRPHNEHLHTFAGVFADRGYDNKFIYGGYGYFDNMNYFFGHNDCAIVDRADLADSEVTFENAWGVCDENLLDRVLKEADASYDAGRHFFSFVMTTSNHRPFTFPDGKAADVRPPHVRRKQGVAYTDLAVGAFMREARRRPWFQNTLFVFTADHCASSSGKTDLPLENYRIPLIIYCPSLVKPSRVETLASQIDIGPTVLDILNWRYESSFFGRSALSIQPDQQRAFIANYLALGYLTDTTLTILKPDRSVTTRVVDRAANTIGPEPAFSARYQNAAIAYYQGSSFLYRRTVRDEPGFLIASHLQAHGDHDDAISPM